MFGLLDGIHDISFGFEDGKLIWNSWLEREFSICFHGVF